MFRKKEEKSLLQWTIEEDGKYQNQLIDVIAERNNRINKAIEFLNEECCYDKDLGYCDDLWCGDIPKLIKILKGEDNENDNTSNRTNN